MEEVDAVSPSLGLTSCVSFFLFGVTRARHFFLLLLDA